jgi:hypothetical protein
MRLRWRARRRVQVRNPFPICRLGPTPEANLDKSIALPEHGENFGDDNQNRENNDCKWQGKRKPQREREKHSRIGRSSLARAGKVREEGAPHSIPAAAARGGASSFR